MPSEEHKAYGTWTLLRICIKNASFKMPLLCFECSSSLFESRVFRIAVPARAENTILQNDFKQFESAFFFLDPQTVSKRKLFVLIRRFQKPVFNGVIHLLLSSSTQGLASTILLLNQFYVMPTIHQDFRNSTLEPKFIITFK